MNVSNTLCGVLKIKGGIRDLAKRTGISLERLQYYEKNHKLPLGTDLEKISRSCYVEPEYMKAKMGVFDKKTAAFLEYELDGIEQPEVAQEEVGQKTSLELETKLGKLYRGDCLSLLRDMNSESVDLVFADPPFNLDKFYESKINDNLRADKYLEWCKEWALECSRVLKYGGSLLLWNLPKWNLPIGNYLNHFLTFRHLIAVDIKYRLPIAGRLYPSHYSLLYFCKGDKPTAFHPDRLPMEVCPNCATDLRDYGGYKDKMNPKGISLTDVWYDIPPVRHAKYKKRKEANELSVKLLDRVIEMASNEGDLVFDPFGGSGTTYVVSEMKKRKWIGVEIGPVEGIKRRLENLEDEKEHLEKIRKNYNHLFTPNTLKIRNHRGLWTAESVRANNEEIQSMLELSEKKATHKFIKNKRKKS